MAKLFLTGHYRDTIVMATGALHALPMRANAVTFRALDLIADLLRNREGVRGLLYWAVGSGDPSWDTALPQPDRRARQLVNEFYRKPLDPAQHLHYDPATHTLTVRVSFDAEEAPGIWREFGLFGGNASPRPNTGYLFNHAIHPRFEPEDSVAVERELAIELQSEAVTEEAVSLIAALLRTEPQVAGVQYWAVGSGESDWDETPPDPDRNAHALTHEIYRKPIDANRKVAYVAATRTLILQQSLAFDEARAPLREYGIFGGRATKTPDSGFLITQQIHTRIDKNRPLTLHQELRLTLGAQITLSVPDLTGQSQAEAEAALLVAGLTVGVIETVEQSEAIGQVVDQRPPAGALVAEGATVDLTVAVAVRVVTPNLVGLTQAEAATVLAAAELTLDDEIATQEARLAPGAILQQRPRPGTRVARGSAIQVVVAMPVTTPTPDLSGLIPDEAAVVLAGARLRLAPPPFATEEVSGEYNLIVAQTPTAGERIAEGTAVAITVTAPWSVAVPDLSGLTPDGAADALRAAAVELLQELGRPLELPGLALGAQRSAEAEGPAGVITDQTPTVGERVPLYSTVDITVAIPVTAAVPDLRGLTEAAAVEAIVAAGLVVGRVQRRPDPRTSATVLEQSPPAGVRIARSNAVNLVVAETILVSVPDLIGRTAAYAAEILVGRGLQLGATTQRVDTGPVDSIIAQTPDANSQTPLGATVDIVVTVHVPNVVGLTVTAATVALTAVGLGLASPIREEASPQPVGTILRQTPPAGAGATPGTQVQIVVAIPQQVPTPPLLGMSLAQAQATLANVGLTLVIGGQRISTAPPGSIVEQSPVAGTAVAPGSQVSVIVAVAEPQRLLVGVLGPEPDSLYLHGTSMLAAEHLLQAIYDGPFDQRRFSFQPVIFAERPQVELTQVQVPRLRTAVIGGRITRTTIATALQQMRVTFRLREDLRWADGEPVTAKDSVLSFTLAANRATPCSKLRTARTATYEAVDDFTVVWTGLPGWTDAHWERNFWTPLPSHLMAGVAPAEVMHSDFARQPLAYGPFQISDWREGGHIHLKRNDAYFRSDENLPRVDELVLLLSQSGQQAVELVVGGEAQMALVGSVGLDLLPELRALAEQGAIQLHETEGVSQEYLLLNVASERMPALRDQRVRLALAHALDRRMIVNEVLRMDLRLTDSFVPPVHPAHLADLPFHEFDPERARQFLAEAGFPNGFELRLFFPTGSTEREKVAAIIQAQLQEIGVLVHLDAVEPRKLFAKGADTLLWGRQFEMALMSWTTGVEPPAAPFLCEEISSAANGFGGLNISGWCDDAFDESALRALSTPDAAQRQAQWNKAQSIFVTQLPAIPLYPRLKIAITRPDLSGFRLDPSQPSELYTVEIYSV